MQKHDELPVSDLLRLLKGLPKPGHLSVHQLLRLLLPFLIPSHDPAPAVQIKGAFEGVALRSDQRIILISGKIILQEKQPALKFLIQPFRLLCVPEHIMISPQQDLTAGQPFNKGQILPALRKLSAPGVVAGEHQRVLRLYDLIHIFFYFALMMFPDPAEGVHGLVGLEAQVQVAQCV